MIIIIAKVLEKVAKKNGTDKFEMVNKKGGVGNVFVFVFTALKPLKQCLLYNDVAFMLFY